MKTQLLGCIPQLHKTLRDVLLIAHGSRFAVCKILDNHGTKLRILLYFLIKKGREKSSHILLNYTFQISLNELALVNGLSREVK